MARRDAKKGFAGRLFSGRRAVVDDIEVTIDDREVGIAVDDESIGHEPGDAYLLMEVINLLRLGAARLADFGMPPGVLLLGPHDDDMAARALWSNSLTPAQPRSTELDASLERALGINPRHEGSARAVPAVDEWLRYRFGRVQARLSSDPLVWELATPLGAFQALVDAGTFGPQAAAAIRGTTIQRVLERLRIDVWHDRVADPDRANLLRKHISEIEDLDVTLYRLSRELSDRPFSRARLESAGLLGRLGERQA